MAEAREHSSKAPHATAACARTGLIGPPEVPLRRMQPQVRAVIPTVGPPGSAGQVEHAQAVAEILRQRLLPGVAALHDAVKTGVKLRRMTDLILSFLPEAQLLTRTAAGGVAHANTGSANVDLFFHVNRQSLLGPNKPLEVSLERAWQEHPTTCLKLIFHLGARMGKQDRYGFYDACIWLHKKQPATLLANLEYLPSFTCWKGLCEIVARVCEGSRVHSRDRAFVYRLKLKEPRMTADDGKSPWLQGDVLQQATLALRRYHEDPLYRALHNKVASLFADQLRKDLAMMQSGKRVWSLCAKWCPALGNSFDRRTLLCESIARKLFPASLPEYEGLSEAHYAFRVRDRLRKEVLTPLKAHRREPAVLISARRWKDIEYNKLPAECMRLHTETFKRHDTARFKSYVEGLKTGKATAKRGQRQPHQLLQAMCEGGEKADLAEAQWTELVQSLACDGASAIACCDVSYSMEAEALPGVRCIDVAVAMTVLLSEVPGPFKGKVISFASRPELRTLRGTASTRTAAVKSMPWDRSTNLLAMFDLLLEESCGSCPRQLFIFSDMDFGAATGCDVSSMETDLAAARRRFCEAGLRLPDIVFWNLAGGTGAPALACTPGCVLVSGFSPTIMKQILRKQRLDPLLMVETALATPAYSRLREVDGDVAARAMVLQSLEDGAEVVSSAADETSASDGAEPNTLMTVDLCIVMDCTGSMGGEIAAAKDSILKIAELLQSEVERQSGSCAQLRLACVAYRDHCDGRNRLQGIGFEGPDEAGHAKVRDFIAKQHASGGGDMPEDVFGGMDMALDFEWQSKIRLMLLVADAPCHGELYHDQELNDSLPKGNPFGLTHEGIMSRMSQRDISLLFLGIGDASDRMVDFFERCHQKGPVTRMMMDRNCKDYSKAFEERVGSAIVRKIASAMSPNDSLRNASGLHITRKRKVLQLSGKVATQLPADIASKCIGVKGESIRAIRQQLCTMLRELKPQKSWASAGTRPDVPGESAPGENNGSDGKRRRQRRHGKPLLWLDLKRGVNSFDVVLTISLLESEEVAQEIWCKLATEAAAWLSGVIGVEQEKLVKAQPLLCRGSSKQENDAAFKARVKANKERRERDARRTWTGARRSRSTHSDAEDFEVAESAFRVACWADREADDSAFQSDRTKRRNSGSHWSMKVAKHKLWPARLQATPQLEAGDIVQAHFRSKKKPGSKSRHLRQAFLKEFMKSNSESLCFEELGKQTVPTGWISYSKGQAQIVRQIWQPRRLRRSMRKALRRRILVGQ